MNIDTFRSKVFQSHYFCASQKKWGRARELVEGDPGSLYSIPGNHNHRLVIHELCKLIFPGNLAENSGELSDDEEDEAPDQRPLPACSDCQLEDNKQIREFINFMIEKSHALGPVRVSFPPENTETEDESSNNGQEEGRSEVHESILTVTDSLGKTPLHVLCEHSVEKNLLEVLLSNTRDHNKNPSAPTVWTLIKAKDSRGSTPLHYLAYSRQCPISSLSFIMDYCKPSAEDSLNTDPTLCVDVDGDTPLHWALDGYMSPRRIQLLVRHSKAALRVRNAAGKRPLDQFVGNFVDESDWKEHETTAKESWESIEGYLKVLEEEGSSAGDEWLPIHMLAASNIDFPTVFYDMAFHYDKEDASKLNSNGMLPLHLACGRQSPAGTPPCDETIIYKLLAEYPQAAYKAGGKTKRLPIHVAVESRKPLNVIAALLKAYPNSLNQKDPMTSLWPFLLSAVGNEESIDTSYALLRADPSIVQIAISALISKRGQRAAQALRQMNPTELEEHSHRRLRRLVIRDGYD
jgi:ankyrin repeat protein